HPWETALSGRIPRNIPNGLAALLQPCAQALFAGALLGREFGAEILGFEDLPDLELGILARVRARALLRPRDRLVERLALPHPEARDQLLGLGERAVHRRALAVPGEVDARAFRAGLQPFARLHHARI